MGAPSLRKQQWGSANFLSWKTVQGDLEPLFPTGKPTPSLHEYVLQRGGLFPTMLVAAERQ